MLQREKPFRLCLGGCGRRRRTWTKSWTCRWCVLERDLGRPGRISIRELHRARAGKCVVCGGPYPDGSGCEHCPKVTA